MGTRKPVGLLDLPWLAMDSRRHPMHVGALMFFRAPDGAGDDFVHDLVGRMQGFTQATDPFNKRMSRRGGGKVWPRWETVEHVDLDYHVRHSALPWPHGERELGVLVSRLHRAPLDLGQPLWEMNVIEGLTENRIAVYAKVHHSLMDGVGAIRVIRAALTDDPDRRDMPPLWAYEKPARVPSAARKKVPGGFGSALKAAVAGGRTRPYSAPHSALNTPIDSQRRVSTQSYELARLRTLAQAIDGTLNDVVLAVCAGGLRRYLHEIDALPEKSLIASMPVSVRTADSDGGNAITFAFASLASDIDDVRARTDAIKASAAESKVHLNKLPAGSFTAYTVITMGPFITSQLVGLGAAGRPMYNVLISNVPGPREQLYYNGAPLLELYPVSVLQSGQALNITALSYASRLNLSFTACSASLPHVQRLSVYCADALADLEAAYLPMSSPVAVRPT